jgi:hypothetical protein
VHSPWHGLIQCSECNALHESMKCPLCGHALDLTPYRVAIDGLEHLVQPATQGAIPWSTFAILRQIELERERPLFTTETTERKPAQRLVVVILFWTLFEILMEGFFRAAFADLPGELADELLQRFPSIGGRLDRLYRRTWGVTFWADLETEGFADDAAHLRLVQERRNAFIHGDPEAIDDALVLATLARLDSVQRGWIRLFNKRCIGRRKRIALWEVIDRRNRG